MADTLLDGLNEPQRLAVLHEGGPLLVVAGAGSGKTRVLTSRIAYLLRDRGVSADQVVAITFTNKAAAEMRERVGGLAGFRTAGMQLSTFHSACVRIIRRHSDRLGLPSSFSIYDSLDSRRLLTQIGNDIGLDSKRTSARYLATAISNLKNELIDPDSFASRAEGPAQLQLLEVYRAYQQRLLRAGAVDFDDLIAYTVELFRAQPAVAAEYRSRYRHVLVDEYQDTNHAQYALIRELTGAGSGGPAELVVVGDADQSIYAFRGATIRNIDQFERDFPNAKVIMLEQNYRSTQTILSAANAVISRNRDRREKRLWTSAGDGERIIGYVGDDETDEAAFVANRIRELTESGGVRPSDVAVFYRTNAQSRALEEVFIRVGLPYRVVGGVRFYERKEVRDILAYLRVVSNPHDDVSLRRILNTPRRGIGDSAEKRIDALAVRDRVSFGEALRRVDESVGLAPRSLRAVREFVGMLDEFRAEVAAGTGIADLVHLVVEGSGYLAALRESRDPQDEARVENLA
ncbi:MAG: UvrD-helicase domain-containing protein, partial [Candidatus Nanopelagicales bacterium]|nr:UvrD-helicase domain-containing protein [Candidatus Nanopelagicales bacterium]